jgi:Flp pilus assembly protein TadG
MSLTILYKWIVRLAEDRRASVAITFTFALVPVLALMSLAVDYGRALKAKSALQTALDSAAMMALQSGASAASANFLANASAIGLNLASGSPSFATNSDGSVTVAAQGSMATGLSTLFGVQSSPLSLSSTAKMTHPLTPHSIVYQFQYAKGWYYKVVTLYVQQTRTSATLPLATWTYKAYNDGAPNNSVAAIPAVAANVPYFWSSTASQPTDTGLGITTTSWNATNATTIGATLDSANNKITFNNTYYNLYLTMQVVNSKCAPGQTSSSQNVTASASDEAIFEAVYKKTWTGNLLENIACSGTANNSWSMTVSTNSSTNSNYLYINGVQQPSNSILGLGDAFPCPSGVSANTPVTNNYEWEDSSTSTTGTRDFFFSLTTTCTTNQWSNAPNIPKLVR